MATIPITTPMPVQMTGGSSPVVRQQLDLCEAISGAVSEHWGDVMPRADSGLIHVEYEPSPQHPIAWLKVWSSTRRGYWNLVCEYWMDEHPFGEKGLRFAGGYQSVGLDESIGFIMQHQQKFTPPKNGTLELIQVYPPSAVKE